MRIVLDTNAIIAAFATRGLCAEIFDVCIAEHHLIVSENILSEVQEKLVAKIHVPQKIVQEIISYLRGIAEIVEPAIMDTTVCRDPDDISVIGTALNGKAKFIITGDEDLLVLGKYKEIEIITPREFWHNLRQQ